MLDAVNGIPWSGRETQRPAFIRNADPEVSSSPLVVGDVVIVAAGGKLSAYDAATGAPRWTGGGGGLSYSSPQLVTIDGVEQVVFMSGPGTTSVEPATGKVLWEHAWSGGAIVQPALTPDGDILVNTISMTGGLGLRRISIAHTPGGWTASSVGLQWAEAVFNDFILHKGHAYRFDGSILSCIDLQDGARSGRAGATATASSCCWRTTTCCWCSRKREIALVKAAPDQFTEVARFPRRSRARPGTTRSWSATSCWCATITRCPRSALSCAP